MRLLARGRGAQRAAGGDDVGGDLGEPDRRSTPGRFVERNTRNYCSRRAVRQLRRDAAPAMSSSTAHYLQADFDKQLRERAAGLQRDRRHGGLGLPVLASAPRLTLRARRVAVRNDFRYRRLRRLTCNGTRTSPSNSRIYVRAGAQQTEPENGESDTNAIARHRRQLESACATRCSLDLTRTVEPISAGTVVERYQLRMQIHHDVSPRIALMLGRASVARRGNRDSRHVSRRASTRRPRAASNGACCATSR